MEQTNWDLKKAIEEWELDNNYEEKQESDLKMPKAISKNVSEKKKPTIDSKDKKKRSKC